MLEGKILVVDDQFGIRMLLQEVLKIEGYETQLASNGLEALELLTAFQPDLVFLDMKIPGMDGLEILKKMKEQTPDVKIIMMTAYSELDLINTALSIGALGYLPKPFNIEELINLSKKYISILK